MTLVYREGYYLISIHTPLAGSDGRSAQAKARATISIHTPLAGSDVNSIRLS